MLVIKRFLMLYADQQGVTALEYGMIAALVAVVAIAAFNLLGTNLSGVITSVAQSI